MKRRIADKLCSRCPEPGYAYRGERWQCLLHYRLDTMSQSARSRGKVVPTEAEFFAMVAEVKAGGMRCGHCRRTMVWHTKGAKAAKGLSVSLQHDRGGRVRMICMSCNAIHQTFPDDTFYDFPAGWKWCTCCKKGKPVSAFFKAAKKTWKCRAMTYCRVCRADFQRRGFKTVMESHK